MLIIGLVVGSLFFQLGTSITDARSMLGACFLAIMFISMVGFDASGLLSLQGFSSHS